jgi:hypothetical protein
MGVDVTFVKQQRIESEESRTMGSGVSDTVYIH